jgi:hypothetical protein
VARSRRCVRRDLAGEAQRAPDHLLVAVVAANLADDVAHRFDELVLIKARTGRQGDEEERQPRRQRLDDRARQHEQVAEGQAVLADNEAARLEDALGALDCFD